MIRYVTQLGGGGKNETFRKAKGKKMTDTVIK